MEYWIADRLYGSFNCIIYDGQNPIFKPIENPLLIQSCDIFKKKSNEMLHPSKIMGCTCDSFDRIDEIFHFPELQIGDYFMCENFGAYTHSGAMNFNGIEMIDIPFFYI
jgi:ornithine decarboxylase